MHFSTSLATLAMAATALALPSDLNKKAPTPVNVGFGQQLQNNDQANHWVAWVDGKSACPNVRVLGSLTGSPCGGDGFNIDGFQYKFGDCGSDNNPKSLLDGNGNYIRSCKGHDYKITCHGNEHDIVQHGRCNA